ncbi:MAG: DUF2917 domain-containing protein [Pseudomonadota bacterium]
MDHASTSSSAVHYLQQATHAGTGQVNGLAGCWKLAPGRALSLRAGQAGELRVAEGRVWITFDDAGQDSRVRAGDYFLSQGERLPLLPGQSLVMESFAGSHTAAPVYFSWEPAVAAVGLRTGLLQLRMALGLVAAAAGRLVRGLMGGLSSGVRA